MVYRESMQWRSIEFGGLNGQAARCEQHAPYCSLIIVGNCCSLSLFRVCYSRCKEGCITVDYCWEGFREGGGGGRVAM